MRKKTIYITELDMKRLEELVQFASKSDKRKEEYLRELEEELDRAKVVPSEKIPKNVITMNSKVRIKDLDSEEEMIYSLVFPHSADINQNRISILAPIGTALIGYKVGNIIEWKVPGGVRKLKVEEILYQPEASGNFDQ